MKKLIKYGSIIALLISLAGIFYLIKHNTIISKDPIPILIQITSVGLMIWARITFGMLSFHASANTTNGGLIINGLYKYLRHPIYASIIYFFLACLIAYPYVETLIAVLAIVLSTYLRLLLEEKSLIETYENYSEYSKKTKRLIPFIF
jgi:protein-S-isoprenylcysteine O-methyltransferase Ste14